MRVAKVYIEYTSMAVDQAYHYTCESFLVAKGMRVIVNFANRDIIGFVEDVVTYTQNEIEALPYPLKPILKVVDDVPLMNEELFSLARFMSQRYVASYISCCQTMLPNTLKPKSGAKESKKETWVIFQQSVIFKGAKQQEALQFIQDKKEIRRSEFNRLYPSKLSVLIEREAVVLIERERVAPEEVAAPDQGFSLTHQQQSVLAVLKDGSGFQTYLLHGATGSGKSEVFLQMAKETIEKGKQVLILVPEISLTPQMVKRVTSRFQKQVAIYHSSLNNQEKYEQYKLVLEKKVQIVVGTRSAIFMPFTNLGLIILDEEHDQSYKQDNVPRYHTRDIALYRGEHHQCKVILASATPSLESYARALKKVYTLVEMPDRIYHNLPQIQLINMQDAMRHGEHYIVSEVLKKAIYDRLQKKEQCILLLNRRGYSPILRCLDCGHVPTCPHCDLALNYHKNESVLKCHTCGYQETYQYTCKECGSRQLKFMGLGTQKLEEYIQECFPSAHIVRMDADTTAKKNAHETLLKRFEEKGDILLGTQMIAKGLDFERVTLVGIVNGDALLNRSDYRSVELTFDLLMQASGRSGRGKQNGEVMIQVYDDAHYAIQCVKQHDYKQFFYKEMQFRHLGQYPPYSYLGSMVLLSLQECILQEEANRIMEWLKEKGLYCLGPIALLKRKDLYRMRIIVKSKEEALIANAFYEVYKKLQQSKGKASLEMDLNPHTLE